MKELFEYILFIVGIILFIINYRKHKVKREKINIDYSPFTEAGAKLNIDLHKFGKTLTKVMIGITGLFIISCILLIFEKLTMDWLFFLLSINFVVLFWYINNIDAIITDKIIILEEKINHILKLLEKENIDYFLKELEDKIKKIRNEKINKLTL
jgi:hypothetical protein